jgi:hypothetical protein
MPLMIAAEVNRAQPARPSAVVRALTLGEPAGPFRMLQQPARR